MQDIFCHINCQQEFLIDNDSKNKEMRKHWFDYIDSTKGMKYVCMYHSFIYFLRILLEKNCQNNLNEEGLTLASIPT